jgi:hypothetical protein
VLAHFNLVGLKWVRLSKEVSENLHHETSLIIPATRSMTLGPLSFSGTAHTKNNENAHHCDVSLK